MANFSRAIANLTSPEIVQKISANSLLCLPLGAVEQHGPHLPLDTDILIAEAVTQRIVSRWGDRYDLWQLPTIPIGLSPEHAWARGTLTLSAQTVLALLQDLARSIAQSFPARRLLIVNGHGGNRGILQAAIYDMERAFHLNVCVLHPLVLAASGAPESLEIHGGRDETSILLAIAPERVRMNEAAKSGLVDEKAISALITDLAVTWPWRSDDPTLAREGVTGSPAAASAQWGENLLGRIADRVEPILQQLAARSPG